MNKYGMNDEPLEDMAIETLDLLAAVLISQKEKIGIIKALKKYSAWGNCGIIDDINEAIEKIRGA